MTDLQIDPARLLEWLAKSCAEQGIPLTIEDKETIVNVGVLLKVPKQGGFF